MIPAIAVIRRHVAGPDASHPGGSFDVPTMWFPATKRRQLAVNLQPQTGRIPPRQGPAHDRDARTAHEVVVCPSSMTDKTG